MQDEKMLVSVPEVMVFHRQGRAERLLGQYSWGKRLTWPDGRAERLLGQYSWGKRLTWPDGLDLFDIILL